jgi:hypothetical protein
MMYLAVTIRRDDDIRELKLLIDALRKHLSADQFVVREAPKNFDYPFPFPLVTISEGPKRGRHFGPEAVDVLRELAAAQ